jgi:two-component system, cell cycle response regulator
MTMADKLTRMNIYRPRLGVGTKTLIALSLVFWLPVAALSLLLSHLFQGAMESEVAARMDVQLKGALAIYEERTFALERLLEQTVQRPDVIRAVAARDGAQLQSLLLGFGKQNPAVAVLAAVDPMQRVIARRSARQGDVMNLGDVLPDALRGARTLSAADLVSREFLIREDEELGNLVKELGLLRYVIVPVRDGEHIAGALVAGLLLTADPLLSNAVYSRFGVELALFAGDPRERYSVHATASVPRSVWALGQPLPSSVQQEIHLGRSFSGAVDVGGIRASTAFAPVHDSRGRVIGALGVSMPLQEVDAAVMRSIAKAIAMTAVIGLVVALIAVFFVHTDITRPLDALVKAMRGFGEGELGERVAVETGDQFEDLGRAFNAMAEGIWRREEQFKRRNEVAKLFMSTMDMEELLDQTLRIVVSVTESELGVLYVWEEEGCCLVPRAQYGARAGLQALPLGVGYPGRAAKDRKRLIIAAGAGDQTLSVETGFAQISLAELVYLPLVHKGNVLGVLALGSVAPYREDAVQFFDYLADQISIALDNARLHQRVQELSITDGLTALYNRRFLNTRLEEEWARCKRHKLPISVLLSDIDNFKSINDSYGHDRGDEVLREVAAIFKRNVRKEDLIARYGGEEFVVVMVNASSDDASALAERICADARTQSYGWMDRAVTLSIGVASFPEVRFESADALVQAADQAMYRAKTSGKDQVAAWRAAKPPTLAGVAPRR